jgi:transcriptional regulator with XRE-family HTH domain
MLFFVFKQHIGGRFMDNKKVGSFIASLRKEKGMTQKELADKLNVTNKAVSKWETGEGYPEITTVPELAEILGVNVSELLNGERNADEKNLPKNNDNDLAVTIINETVKYFDETSTKKINIVILITTVLFIFSSFVCLLCNYIVNRAISWSLYPTGALIVLWCGIVPMLKMKKYKSMSFLTGITMPLIPYLFLIEHIAPVKGWVIPMALPITIVSFIALAVSFYIFNNTKINKLYCSASTVLIFGIGVNIFVDKIVDNFLKDPPQNNLSPIITIFSSTFIAMILIAIGYIKSCRLSKED